MANTFLQFMLREVKSVTGSKIRWSYRRKIRDYVVGLIPEPVRKIVGLILIIFGVVAILGFWIAALFWLTDYMVICVIGVLVGIGLIGWGIDLLRHKG